MKNNIKISKVLDLINKKSIETEKITKQTPDYDIGVISGKKQAFSEAWVLLKKATGTDNQTDTKNILYHFITWYNAHPKQNRPETLTTSTVLNFLKHINQ